MRIAPLLLLTILSIPRAFGADPIRVGIIGLDTSHVIAFTRILNDPSHPDHVPGARVVAAYKGGSPDLENSRNRIDGFTKDVHEKWGVEIVDSIPELCDRVDAVLLESVDGRKHLEQVRPVFEAGKRVFIDKPLAASLADAREIARLGREHGVPWWSASSLRYTNAAAELRIEGMTGAISWGPGPIEPSHELDLSWYGIHPVELLYSLMGPGCVRVRRVYTEGADVITGEWKDGRLGVVRTIRDGKSGYGAVAFGAKEVRVSTDAAGAYRPLMERIVEFFKTGKPPVSNAETLEIFSFMDAALRSRKASGEATDLR